MGKRVRLQDDCVLIDDKPTILLASSLFYFRIPQEYWYTRMKQLKVAGYNAIDVYFPWNFHELNPGEWCFDGMRDVGLFLEMASREKLYVIARPGPYICSEWDGGGIPAWLDQEKHRLRQYDDEYLKAVSRWMDRIMPIISKYQLGNDGTIVLLQLENELDSFPCIHPARYLEALAEMAARHQIEIPYVACTSQYDIVSAGGNAKGVNPSYNIYMDPDDPMAEEKMKELYNLMLTHHCTFLTTETNREHRFMRRELVSGLRLISPYCQTASSNFDCFNGISNWGGNHTNPL